MSGSTVIGALRATLSADNDNFDTVMEDARKAVGALENALDQMGRKLEQVGAKITKVTAGIAVAFTASFGTLEVAATRSASSVEDVMKRVATALNGASPKQLAALEAQARTMGVGVGRGASEAAGALEDLAKQGLTAGDILGGAFAASLKLATANSADLGPAADVAAGVMQKFGVAARDLGPVVDKVTGALLTGRGGIDAYKQAINDAGEDADKAGISFDDFNTTVAAIGQQLHKGAEAGGAIKSFLSSLADSSKQAKQEMKDLGISFQDAHGHLKPLADIAAILQKTMTGLSEQARKKVLTDMFGADGMTTAIALMQMGKQGFLDLQATIDKTSADKAAASQQDTYSAALKRLGAAFENLKVAIGNSGLLGLATKFTDTLASIVNWIGSAHPALTKLAGVFSGLAAAMAPVLATLGGVLWFAFGRFLRGMGEAGSLLRVVGWGLSAILEPIGTLIAAMIKLTAAAGSGAIFRVLGTAIAEMVSPIGLAIAAFMLFKDDVIPVLEQLWTKAVAVLGPPLEALLAKVGALFSGLGTGQIGAAIGVILDVLGTLAAYVTSQLGGAFIEAVGIIIGVLSTLVSMVQDVVTAIADLLNGDFAGAWAAAGQFVDDAVQGIVDIIKGLFPGASAAIQAFYNEARAWLVDGIKGIADYFTGIVDWAVTSVESAFPRAIAAAKGMYEGIKTWLVDALGPVGTWIAAWAGGVADRFEEVKKGLGLGGGQSKPAAARDQPASPPKPKPGKVTNSYMPKDADDGRDKKDRHGETAEDLRIQKELEAAKLSGDRETEQSLQDQLDLNKQVEAYQRTGLNLSQARARAEQDMKDIQAARAIAASKEMASLELTNAIEVATLDKNILLEDSLSRQAALRKRIDAYYAAGKTLADATKRATDDQNRVDEARERVRKKWLQDDADARTLALAQTRGDTDEEIRQLQRVIDVKKRAADLEAQHVAPAAALAQANSEADADEHARITGLWRTTLRDGVKAAMDGDLKDFVKNWWKDRVAKGMEEALNSLSNLLLKIFSQVKSNIGSGQGLLSSVGSAFGQLFGGGKAALGFDTNRDFTAGLDLTPHLDTSLLPAFATGGSFKVGGMSGIDQNVVSMRLSRGEMVDVRKEGQDGGPIGSVTINQPITLNGGVDLATRTETYRLADATYRATLAAVDEKKRRAA